MSKKQRHPICKAVGERIRELRNKTGQSAEAFAFDAEIDTSYLTSIERGERNPSLDVIDKIRIALNATWDDIFKGLKF